MSFIDNKIAQINTLCKKHNVGSLFVFGSVLTERFNQDSDIDMVVNFNPIELNDYVDNYFSLKDSLENLLEREVDLLEDKAIKNPILRNNIDRTKQLIYG